MLRQPGFAKAATGPPAQAGGTMSRAALATALALAFATAAPSWAAVPALRFFTPDGTWDCKDEASARTGTIVLADTAYAFIDTEGKLAGYGKVSPIDGDFHLPKFVVPGGPLKEKMNVIGLAIHGPEGDPENFNAELFLFVVVGFDSKHHWDCVRRGGRANMPPA
jgi:hypothetical protein